MLSRVKLRQGDSKQSYRTVRTVVMERCLAGCGKRGFGPLSTDAIMHYGVFYQAMNTEYWCRKLVFPQPGRVSAEPPADLTKTAQGFYFQELHASLQNSSACHTHITSHFHPPSNVWQGGEWLITPES